MSEGDQYQRRTGLARPPPIVDHRRLLNDREYTDIVFVFGDGNNLEAHSYILKCSVYRLAPLNFGHFPLHGPCAHVIKA